MKYYPPLDPECPVANDFRRLLFDDPMTAAMGAPTGEIMAGFERKHRRECQRCRNYGLANIILDEFLRG